MTFGALMVKKVTFDEIFYSKVLDIQVSRSLKLVRFGRVIIEEDGQSMKKLDLVLSFVLQSCPYLKKFKLIGAKTNARGVLKLDFRENHLLQHINLDMPNCRYYTFYHEFGKFSRNVNEQIMQDHIITQEQEQDLSFIVNLAWDTSMDIDIQLAGCGL